MWLVFVADGICVSHLWAYRHFYLDVLPTRNHNFANVLSTTHEAEGCWNAIEGDKFNWSNRLDVSFANEVKKFSQDPNSPCQYIRSVRREVKDSVLGDQSIGDLFMGEVDCSERGVAAKWLPRKLVTVDNIIISNLNHSSAISDDSPGFVQEVSGKRIQNDINTFVLGNAHNLVGELCRS